MAGIDDSEFARIPDAVRGASFIGDALSHAVLPGVVLAIILGVNVLIGALAAALVSVLGIGTLTRHRSLKEDTAIGVIFSGAFALGILLLRFAGSYSDLTHILFGNILGVSMADVLLIAGIGVVVVLAIFFFYKELLVTSFDPTHATAIGLSPDQIQYGLLVVIAATTVISVQTVGVVLVLALLVTPAAIASLLAKQLSRIIALSVLFSLLSILIGSFVSYHTDLSPGAIIVLVLTSFFMVAFAYSKVKILMKV